MVSQDSGTPLFGLRPLAQRLQSSPAPLRLALQPAARGRLQVDLFKRRGPALARPLSIALEPGYRPAVEGRESEPEVAEEPLEVLREVVEQRALLAAVERRRTDRDDQQGGRASGKRGCGRIAGEAG